MNAANLVHLDGTVHGDYSTWWKPRGRGQVRFWLAVSRELAGDGYDLFLVAIEPKTAEELFRLEKEIRDGRSCAVAATANSLVDHDLALWPQQKNPGVIFVAESCGLDGSAERSAHKLGAVHRHRLTGKLAAAADDTGLELGLEVRQ